jgi:5'-nucleotidase
MPYDLTNYLVIGVSSRALFDLNTENEIYEKEGLEAYCRYQLEHENDVLKPGTGFALIEAILGINELEAGVRRTEVVIISRNSADTSLRISNSIDSYKLDITRAAFTGGEPVAKYLNAFDVDLFLSATEEDVQAAVESNVAAGLIYDGPGRNQTDPLEQIRIAFDGDAVLFSKESEMIYQQQGLEAFIEHEKLNAEKPLPEGIRTLRTWKVRIDETFFLGGVPKHKILESFSPHIFFDDQHQHCEGAARVVPTARVPHKGDETKTA